MSMLAEELIDYVQTTSALWTKGTDVFYNFMPEPDIHPDVMHVVREAPAPPGPLRKPWAVSNVQIISRGDKTTQYSTVREEAAKIYNFLHGIFGASMTNNKIVKCEGQGLPAPLGPDERGRFEVSANYQVLTYAIVASGEDDGPPESYGGDKDPNL